MVRKLGYSPSVSKANDAPQRRESLPSAISYVDKDLTTDSISELDLATWARYNNIEFKLYRPFVYRLIHAQPEDWPFKSLLYSYAEKAVENALDPLCCVGLSHRHAGTWYKAREAAGRSLMLLFCTKNGLIESMGKMDEARQRVDLYVDQLRYWERESVDLLFAREAIEFLRGEVF